MSQENSGKSIAITVAIITGAAAILAAFIGGFFILRAAEIQQSTELTKVALQSASTQGSATPILSETQVPGNTSAPPILIPTETPIPPTIAVPTSDSRLFWDDFSSLPKSEWKMEGVNYSVVDNKLVAQNGSFAGYIGNSSWSNYAVVLKNIFIPLSSTSWPNSFIDIPIRMADKNNAIVFRAYLAWAGSSNSRFTWLILQNGTENEIPDASGSFKAYDSPVIIRLEVNGTQYSTIVNGFSVKSFSDNTFASGGTGIRAVNFEFKLDAFIVEKLP